MRIQQIHIDRYGLFSDTSFDFSPSGIQVLYGKNEIGKSTLMRLIRDILFGFSSRSPGISEESAGFGGRLNVEIPGRGMLTIERTGHKGKGTPCVYFDDGTTGGEKALGELLQGLDEAIFQAIFSFGLDGLQGLERLRSENLNDYLFHAGMTGSFSIQALEQKLEKKQSEWFKPRGQNPILNQQLAELEILEKDVQQGQKENDSYQQFVEELKTIQARLAEIKPIKADKNCRIRTLEQEQTMIPYVQQDQKLEIQLKQLPAYDPFPRDGRTRYEKWKEKKVDLDGEYEQLMIKQKAALEKLEQIDVKEKWLDLKDDVRCGKEQLPLMQARQNEKTSSQVAVKMEEGELTVALEKLGAPWTEEAVRAANTGLSAKRELMEWIHEKDQTSHRLQLLQDEKDKKERILEERQTEIEQFSGRLLAGDEKKKLEEQVHRFNQAGHEGEPFQQKIWNRHQMAVLFGGLGVSVIFLIWLVLVGQWVPGVAAAVLIAGGSFYVGHLLRQTYEVKLNTDGSRKNIGEMEAEEARRRLLKDDEACGSLALAEDRLTHDEKAFANTKKQIREAEQALHACDARLAKWCDLHHFPMHDKSVEWLDLFAWVEEAKQRIRKRDHARENSRNLEAHLLAFEEKVKALCSSFSIAFQNSEMALRQMASLIEEQEQNQQRKQQLQGRVEENEERIQSLTEQIHHYQKQCDALLRLAEVEDEESFYQKSKAWQESRDLLEEQTSVQTSMKAILPDDAERKEMISRLRRNKEDKKIQIRQLQEEIRELEDEEEQLRQRQAVDTAQKENLEKGGIYAERVHLFEQKKNRFLEDAKQWAVYRIAAHVLNKTKEQYRNVRLPKVIESASGYFSLMTGGRYIAIFAPEHEGFVVERSDGVRFSPNQLSRGTAEQLYLSIRLGLAEIYQAASPYPFIMDDILVNFDTDRTAHAIQAIRTAAKTHQVLFFTCHSHIAAHFLEDEVISLRKQERLSI